MARSTLPTSPSPVSPVPPALTPAARGVRGMARRAPLGTFFTLALGLTWLYHAVVLGLLHLPAMPWAIPGTFGPTVAALLTVALAEGGAAAAAFWRGVRRPRVGAGAFLLAAVAVPVVTALAFVFLPGGLDGLRQPVATIVIAYLIQLVVILLGGGGLNEEPGWRGFALPRLQRSVGPLKGSLVLGLVWGLWHLSLYLFTPDYNGAGGGLAVALPMFLAFLVSTAALTIVFTWIYNRARGSVLLLMLVHASFNAALQFAPASRASMLGAFGLSVVVALIVLVATGGRLGWTREGPAATAAEVAA